MMSLRRTPLLFEADFGNRSAARAVSFDPGDSEAARRHAQKLRRRGQHREGDELELDALGRERASAYDEETRLTERRNTAHTAMNAAYRAVKPTQKLRIARREAHSRRQEAGRHLEKVSTAWHELAARVHAAGGNPALAWHRPSLQTKADHREQLASRVAHRNQVSVDYDAEDGHGFVSIRHEPRERRDHMDRTVREMHEALTAHHPSTNPEIRPARYQAGTIRQHVRVDL